MLGAELGHVEADVGALVAEQQAGDGLRQLGLADPGGPGEEGHAARAVALAAGADPGHRALDDVQHVGHRVLLALTRRRTISSAWRMRWRSIFSQGLR